MHFSLHTPRAEHPTPAVFLDRDGTINVEKNYLYRIEDWEWISGAQDSIKMLREAGYLIVVVSNQAGIARGLYSTGDVDVLHAHVQQDLAVHSTCIDSFYYCPHHPDFDDLCTCRKPAPGMLLQAAKDLNIDLSASWMIGDKAIDVSAGHAAGLKSMLVKSGYGSVEMSMTSADTPVFQSVVEAASHIRSITLAIA
jgi:D-glycero-D-manno-heptose 1,7-bisphosphate phosphatase